MNRLRPTSTPSLGIFTPTVVRTPLPPAIARARARLPERSQKTRLAKATTERPTMRASAERASTQRAEERLSIRPEDIAPKRSLSEIYKIVEQQNDTIDYLVEMIEAQQQILLAVHAQLNDGKSLSETMVEDGAADEIVVTETTAPSEPQTANEDASVDD